MHYNYNDNINSLNRKKYLISPSLHYRLSNSPLKENNTPIIKDSLGVYLVSLRLLNVNTCDIVFNYVNYNKLLLEALITYFHTRSLYNTYFTREMGHYLVIISDDLYNNNESLLKFDNMDIKEYIETQDINKNVSVYDMYNILHRITHTDNYTNIAEIVNSILKRNNDRLKSLVFNNLKNNAIMNFEHETFYVDDNHDLEQNKDFSLLNRCLFIVKDIHKFKNSLNEVGYNINEGNQKWRGQINSMNNFNSLLDTDFRNSLYNHNKYHVFNNNLDSRFLLAKNIFSFSNIHMKLGNVRYHSTTRNVNRSGGRDYSVKSRQELFSESYKLITDILTKNNNIGVVELQQEIEDLLFKQESNFSVDSISNNKLRLNEESFNIINDKKVLLIKLLSNPDFVTETSKSQGSKYVQWVTNFVETLGVEDICNLLLSFFVKILSSESIKVKDVDTPGIPTIWAFDSFGDILKSRYIFHLYVNSQKGVARKDWITLTEYKKVCDTDLSELSQDNFNILVGGYFVWALTTVTLLYQELDSKVDEVKHKEYYLRIPLDIRKTFLSERKTSIHIPQKLPMICEPKDFVYSENGIAQLGGFLSNDLYFTEGIFKEKMGYGEKTTLSNENVIIDMINGLSKTPYKINTNVLEFIYKYGYNKDILINDGDEAITNFINNPYKTMSKRDKKIYRSLHSKILLERNILSIAQTYSKLSKIYFPVRMDQRTRIYCETDFLNYQSTDLAKGLISFANPGIILKADSEVIKYFKAFGANMFGGGLDKKSLNLRAKWVDDNSDKILSFHNNNIVNKAENKCCFIAFCFEYRDFIEFMEDKNKVKFYTYLPLQLDASCNGYQHLVLLTKETKLFNKLNLDISSHDNSPDDFYTYILGKTNEYIKTEYKVLKNSELSDKESNRFNILSSLVKVSFGRDIIKIPIMTKSYNAGIPKQVENIINMLTLHTENKETFYTYKDSKVKLKRDHIFVFVSCMKRVIDTESPKIKQLSKYLSGIAGVCTKLSIPIPWNLPSGAEIKESYLAKQEWSAKSFSFIKGRYTFRKYIKGVYDLEKQRRATMPNLIHSLDATTIALLFVDIKKYGSLYTVHDCFAVTANNVPVLLKMLKNVYLQLYSNNNYLNQFDSLVRLTINNLYGDKVFPLDSNFIYLDKKIPFPNINDVTKLDVMWDISSLISSSNILI